MLVPTIRSIGISFASRTFRTPMCARPRAAPPPRASPTLNPSNIPDLPLRRQDTDPGRDPVRAGVAGFPSNIGGSMRDRHSSERAGPITLHALGTKPAKGAGRTGGGVRPAGPAVQRYQIDVGLQ